MTGSGSRRAVLTMCGVWMLTLAWLLASPGASAPAAQESRAATSVIDLSTAASELPQLRSLLVSWRGELIAEHYARGVRPTGLANIKSASKSIIAALVGIAIERGLIKGVREPIVSYFPELRAGPRRRKRDITIEDLLTMRSGLESTSGRNYGAWVQSRELGALRADAAAGRRPGRRRWSTAPAVRTCSPPFSRRRPATSTWQFAQESLARPLGFTLARWPQDPQGIYFGGNEMLMTPRQMIAIGELYLEARQRERPPGRAGVVGRHSCMPRTFSAYDPDRLYGYGWWIQAFESGTACFAWGYGGQYIFVFRDLDLVVTATSSTAVSEERRGHRRQLFELIEQKVLRPVRTASGRR